MHSASGLCYAAIRQCDRMCLLSLPPCRSGMHRRCMVFRLEPGCARRALSARGIAPSAPLCPSRRCPRPAEGPSVQRSAPCRPRVPLAPPPAGRSGLSPAPRRPRGIPAPPRARRSRQRPLPGVAGTTAKGNHGPRRGNLLGLCWALFRACSLLKNCYSFPAFFQPHNFRSYHDLERAVFLPFQEGSRLP